MAVTFLDTPGTEVAQTERIDFTVDNLVGLVIGAGLDDSAEPLEFVFADGVFLYPYLSSTHDGLGGFSIIRTRGWPDGFKVRVFEQAGGALPLNPLYEVDFRSLPDQTLTNPGAVVIDGVTWFAKNSLTGQPFGQAQTNAVVNGSGLGIASTNTGAATPLATGAVVYPYRHMFLPFANIDGYDPAAPLLVRWHATDAGGSNGAGCVAGIVSSTSDGVGLTAAQRQYDAIVDCYNGSSGNPHNSPGYKRGNGDTLAADNSSGSLNSVAAVNAREFGVYRLFGETTIEVMGAAGAWANAFGTLAALLCNASAVQPFRFNGARPNSGFFFAIAGQLNATPVYLTHLQIMQPKVAS